MDNTTINNTPIYNKAYWKNWEKEYERRRRMEDEDDKYESEAQIKADEIRRLQLELKNVGLSSRNINNRKSTPPDKTFSKMFPNSGGQPGGKKRKTAKQHKRRKGRKQSKARK